MILFGGVDPQAPIMLLDGGAWRSDAQINAPSPRYLAAMAFDPRRNVTVLFGGGDPASDKLFNETWEFSAATGWKGMSSNR
jgi:hypothetical protein